MIEEYFIPSKSKSQYRFFKFLESHPEEAKAKGLSKETVKEFTDMSKERFKHLKEKVKKPSKK